MFLSCSGQLQFHILGTNLMNQSPHHGALLHLNQVILNVSRDTMPQLKGVPADSPAQTGLTTVPLINRRCPTVTSPFYTVRLITKVPCCPFSPTDITGYHPAINAQATLKTILSFNGGYRPQPDRRYRSAAYPLKSNMKTSPLKDHRPSWRFTIHPATNGLYCRQQRQERKTPLLVKCLISIENAGKSCLY